MARNKVGNGAGQSLGSNVINWVLDGEHHLLSPLIKLGLTTQERKKTKKKQRTKKRKKEREKEIKEKNTPHLSKTLSKANLI